MKKQRTIIIRALWDDIVISISDNYFSSFIEQKKINTKTHIRALWDEICLHFQSDQFKFIILVFLVL